jgi:DNA polymerase-3 subunit gamma/tau
MMNTTLLMPDQDTPQEQYIVTARKWRPQRFADVVGQEHVSRTLRNAVQSGRIHHAYIFNGPRGVGKTTTARILAKAVNCENPSPEFEPCNVCASCTEINTGRSMDVIEIDGASNNSVDDIRKLRENAKYPPIKGQYKMYIIDEVHMLSTSAFNALLKTLEEPPRHLLFVFATTEPHKVPATILSRCQRFDFRRMQIDEIAAQLRYIATQEGITIDDESLAVIGKKGDGSMRDSQSIFDQVIAFCGRTVEYARVNEALNLIDTEFYFTLGRAIREHDVATILDFAREVFMRGYDLQECLHGLAEHFRNLLTVLATGSAALIEASKLHREQYLSEAQKFTQEDVLQYMTIIMNTEQALRFAPQPRLRFEFALVQMAKMDSAIQLSELLAELAELKKKIERGEINIAAITPTVAIQSAKASLQSALPTPQVRITADKSDTPQASVVHSSEEFAPSSVEKSVDKSVEKRGNVENFEEKEGTPSSQRKSISADELERSWGSILAASETVDAAVKAYLQQQEMVQVECRAGELVCTCEQDFVADKLIEKQVHISDIFSQALGGDVRITVRGGSNQKAESLFEAFSPSFSPSSNAGVENSQSTSEAVAKTGETSLLNGASPTSTMPNSAIPKAELPDLDKAIVELFGAVAVPIR